MMTKLTAAEIYEVARDAGFSRNEAITWTAIALAESGGNPRAHNPHGEDSWGLWQINIDPGVRQNRWGDLTDPEVNARAAYEISGHGENLRPWTVTHESNRDTARDYRRYLDDAREAAANGDDGRAGSVVSAQHEAHADGVSSATAPQVRPIEDAELDDSWHAPRSGGRVHEGIDIFAPEGTPIHAVAGGTVVKSFDGGDLGGVVVRIQGDDGRYYYYAHLKEGSPADYVQVGKHVDAGEVIGEVGDTGNARGTGHHLHLGIRENGEWVNPYPLLLGLPDVDEVGVGQERNQPLTDDADQDALSDYDEIDMGSDPHSPDSDRDGLLDGIEVRYHTSLVDADTDDDALSDPFEIGVVHSNPTKADTDSDWVPDAVEYLQGCDVQHGIPHARQPGDQKDPDHDALSTGFERSLGTDPRRADTDLDSLPDNMEYLLGTDPLSADTDRDGLGDEFEVSAGSDPLVALADARHPPGSAIAAMDPGDDHGAAPH